MVQKFLIRFFTLLLILVECFCPVFQGRAELPPEKVVRTGYTVPDAYMTHPEDMVKTGYTYDYLQMIASYNNWQYEYVYGSWSEQLKKLETGEIDVLSNVSKTPERAKKYLFPDYPLRIEIYYIYAPKEKASLYDKIGDLRGRQKRAADVLARVDLLTGLPNRRAYEEKLREIQQNPPTHLMAVALDLNGLKKANDTRGHQAGDELLRAVGDCFRKTCGEAAYQEYTCLGYRVGGDEFVYLLYMDEKTFESFSDSFQKNVSQWKGKRNDCLSIAQGYAGWYEFPGVPVTELLRVADNRMYEDKERYHRERGRR